MINIILCGANGKMGRVVESCVATRENMKVVCGVDVNDTQYSDFPIHKSIQKNQSSGDVIIDFSHPSALETILSYAISTKTAFVAATTGYSDEQIAKIKKASETIPVFFTFNMSIGINLLLELCRKATKVLSSDFDIEIIEKHHNQKIDAPSGTAIMLAGAINKVADDRYKYEYDRHSKRQKRDKNEIGIHAVRGGTIVGEHEVIFAGRDETITLSHSANSKEIFAVGAVNAANFLCGKPAGLYDMSQMI